STASTRVRRTFATNRRLDVGAEAPPVARLRDHLSDRALRNLKPRPTPYPEGGQLYFHASPGKDEGQVNTYGEFRFATTTLERAANSGLGPERWMGLGTPAHEPATNRSRPAVLMLGPAEPGQ